VRKLLLVTGGAGNIATAMRRLLGEQYRLRLVDRRPIADPRPDEEAIVADVSDLAAVEPVVRGADAVLHLAGDPRVPATWDELVGPNIQGTYAVFEAARRAGVGKVVFATTNHVMGFYNLRGEYPIRTDQPVRPDSYYGVTKAFGEALARYYADAFGMSMICIRIGWFLERPHVRHALGLYVSPRDLAQLFRLALETPITFGIYNGTSNNSRREWDLESARRDLGYAPVDDSERYADQVPDEPSPGDWPYAGVRPPMRR
jgi:NAD+ dependent glucose-6-phosphate dehydrogenase